MILPHGNTSQGGNVTILSTIVACGNYYVLSRRHSINGVFYINQDKFRGSLMGDGRKRTTSRGEIAHRVSPW